MSENSNIIDVTETEFNDQVIEASENKLIVVDFWAPWCGPCKQLTPILEKIINKSGDKVKLVKINIDENQQISAQLRIQSIPTVYAFKDKQIVNAFQGLLSEKQIIEFIEKSLGSKLIDDFTDFYNQVRSSMSENKFEETRDLLLEFISKNSNETQAISLYLECLLELKQFEEIETFIESLEDELKNNDDVQQIVKRLEIIKDNQSGPSVDELIQKLKKDSKNINLVIELANKYFSIKRYEDCFDLLLENYFNNKKAVKEKMVEFFSVLGNESKYTAHYRKKLSQVVFS